MARSSSNGDFKRWQEELDDITSSQHAEPLTETWYDFNRNGMLSLFGLARWTEINLKSVLKGIASDDVGFVFARHITFDSIDRCLSYSRFTFIRNTMFKKLGLKSLGMPSLMLSTYFTETSKRSVWSSNHAKRIKFDGDDEYIGHSVGLNVSVNRIKRKSKNVSQGFKKKVDKIWNNEYPKQLKPKYISLKQILSNHLSSLKEIRMNKIGCNVLLLYSYKLQLRYMDEDRNHHLNFRSYINQIEECLMNYSQDIANNKYLNYSVSITYWKEINVTKYEYCFVNIYKKEIIFVKEKNGKDHIGYDLYGTISVCKCCERNNKMNEISGNDQHEHEWIHHTGFVTRSFDVKAYRAPKPKL